MCKFFFLYFKIFYRYLTIQYHFKKNIFVGVGVKTFRINCKNTVNEKLTGTSRDTLSVGNHYSGRKYKPNELIDETDYENMSEKANKTEK